MNHIHNFATEAAYQAVRKNNYVEPWVSLTKPANRVDYNKSEAERLAIPLTFELLQDTNLSNKLFWFTNNQAMIKTIQYSYNGGEWKTISSTAGAGSTEAGGAAFDLPSDAKAGDIIQFRGNNSAYGDYHVMTSSNDYYNKFSIGVGSTNPSTGSQWTVETLYDYMANVANTGLKFKVYGNIMSLIDATNFASMTTLPASTNANFKNLFVRMPIIDASDLILPSTTLMPYCYAYMFRQCTLLENGPELPQSTLITGCYNNMFEQCISLKELTCLSTSGIGTTSGCTTNWLINAGGLSAITPVFYKNQELLNVERSDSGVPQFWTIQNAS